MLSIRKPLTLALLRALRYPHRLVPAALRRNARKPAFADGTPYGALDERVRRLAGAWMGAGLGPGERVLIDLPNDPAFVEARLACILAGLVAVPVPPGTSGARLGWIAEAAEAGAYLGPRGDALPGLFGIPLDPRSGDREGYERVLREAAPLRRTPPIAPDALLTINFTSGTTGEPKGVMSTVAGWGASLYHALRENRVAPGRGEAFLHAIPLATAGSTLILPAVLSGARNLFVDPWDAGEALRLIERERVTRVFVTPTMLAELVDRARARPADLSSLRCVIYGTEKAPAARVRKAVETLGPVLQQGYGMAEALPPVCLLHPDEHARAAAEGDEGVLGSAGRPTGAVEVRVCGPDGRALGPGEAGSIRVRGPTVSPGYWRRPDLTEATRTGGWYLTGDTGFLDPAGYLHVLGREGRVLSGRARDLVEWAESRSDVCLAWAREGTGGIGLHVVPSCSGPPDPGDLERRAAARAGCPVRVVPEPEAPKTPSYKLKA